MLRSQLIPYLVNLFSGGQPSGLDFKALIEGLGTDEARPHLVCVSSAENIPDNLLFTSKFDIPTISDSGSSSSDCGCPPPPCNSCGNHSGMSTTVSKMSAIDILCDWFKEGWAIDCIGISSVESAPRAYYWVISQDVKSGNFEVISAQFSNPGFDKGRFKSENAIRLVRWVYDRAHSTVVSTEARLVLSDLSDAVLSNQVREIRVVTEKPPMQEDNVLYIELKLPALEGFDVERTSVSTTSAVFSWQPVEGATGYVYRLGVSTPWVATESPCVITGLSKGVEYIVQFKALGDGSAHGDSAVVTEQFTTLNIAQLSQPVLSTVPTAVSCTVSWDAVLGASSYAIKLGKSGDIQTVSDTSYLLKGLSPGQSYEAHVRAKSSMPDVLDSDWIVARFTTLDS